MSTTPRWLDEDENSASSHTDASPRPPVTPPSATGRKALEEAGLAFLCGDGTSSAAAPPTKLIPAPPATPPKAIKNSGNIIVDDVTAEFISKSNTTAPVHFLKRMQQAEALRVERHSERAAGVGKTPTPPPREKNAQKPTTPRKSQQQAATPSSVAIGVDAGVEHAPVDLSIVPTMSEDNKRLHASLIAAVGEDLVAKLVSCRFQHRVDAQHSLVHLMTTVDGSRDAVGTSILKMLLVGLRDAVLHVVTAAAQAVRDVVEVSIRVKEWERLLSAETIEAQLAELVKRLREPNTRCHDAVVSALFMLARASSCGSAVVLNAVTKVEPTAAAATSAYQSRIEFSVQLLQAHKDLLRYHWKQVMELAVIGLNSSSSKVRRNAITLTNYVHTVAGKDIEAYLSSVNPATVKCLMEEIGGFSNATAEELLLPAVSALDHQEQRQEEEDLAVFAAENVKLRSEDDVLVEMWSQTLKLRSAACIMSSHWKTRERLIERLIGRITNSVHGVASADTAIDLTNPTVATCIAQLVERAVNDNVPPVANAAFRCVKEAVSATSSRLVSEFISSSLAALVKKHSLPQFRDLVVEVVLQFLRTVDSSQQVSLLDGIIGSETCSKQTESTAAVSLQKLPAKLMQSRLEILQQVAATLFRSVSAGSSTAAPAAVSPDVVKRILDAAVFYMDAPHPKVRAAVCGLVIEMHHHIGSAIEPFLVRMTGPAMEELRSRLTTAARAQRNAKAQRLFNIVRPLADANSPNCGDRNVSGEDIKERILGFQRNKRSGGDETPLATPTSSKCIPTAAVDFDKVTGVNNVSAARTTPGKKTRLMFA